MFTVASQPKDDTFQNLLNDAENHAPGLSDDEVFAILGIAKDEFKDKPDQLAELTHVMLRGRAMANKKAVDFLFGQMSSRGGEKACIDYLKRFGAEWPENAEYESDKVGSFKVII